MKIFCDTASLAEIEEWNQHPWVAGFTTNPTLMRAAGQTVDAMQWAKEAVALTDKPISIDGPEEIFELGYNVCRKVICMPSARPRWSHNHTAICHVGQLAPHYHVNDIISVFCGRLMDAGHDPQPLINAARARGAEVLWASVREPYNIIQAQRSGVDIVTVPPAILRKYHDWMGKDPQVIAEETIAQFERDREGLW